MFFFVLFTWIAGAFWTAVAGFVIRLTGRPKAFLHPDDVEGRPITSRTALIMCVYNEDPKHFAAGVDAIWTSLKAQAEQAQFDFFILSDTRKPEIAAEEEQVWKQLVRKHRAQGRIFYRRREKNISRKAGNVADFVRQWGGRYDHMLVLDADSVMSGKCVVTLARLLDANPKVGLIQTLPTPAGRETSVRPLAAVRCPPEFADALERPRVVAAQREQLLGPQRDHARAGLRQLLRAAEAAGQGAVRGRDPEPRLRRGRAAASGRLRSLDGA